MQQEQQKHDKYSLHSMKYTLLRLSHIHEVVVQVDTEASIYIATECVRDNSVVCSSSGLYHSYRLTTLYCRLSIV